MRKELKLTEFIGTEVWLHLLGEIYQRGVLLNFNQFGIFLTLNGEPDYQIKFYPWTSFRSLEMTREEEK